MLKTDGEACHLNTAINSTGAINYIYVETLQLTMVYKLHAAKVINIFQSIVQFIFYFWGQRKYSEKSEKM